MFTRGLCLLRPCFTGVSVWNPSGPTCASTCLTVSDTTELPDPPDGCEFAELRQITLTGYAIALYQWDGAAWELLVGVNGVFNAGEVDDVDYGTTGDWVITLNGVEVSGIGTHTFTPAVSELNVVFIDGACSYAMEPAVSTPVPLLSLFMNDTTQLPFDPEVASNWDGFAGNTSFTDVIVTGTNSVDLYGFVISDEVFSDGLGILQFGTNVLTITDHQGFITEIAQDTFTSSVILGVTFPALQIVGAGAFGSCASFVQCGSAVITTIGGLAFSGTQMSEGEHLLCTSVGTNAFSGTACTTLNFPLLEEIPVGCFDQMASLTSADFAACLVIGGGAFEQSTSLATINFPLVVTIGTNAFQGCAIVSISLPACTTLLFDGGTGVAGQFADNLSLIEFIAPLLTSMGDASDNSVFLNISGNTIDITVSSVLQTIDGGNPDGDLVYLAANNTANITYV